MRRIDAAPSRGGRGIHSLLAILVAAAIATVLSPYLFYGCTIPVSETAEFMLFTGPLAAFHAGVSAFSFTPLVLVGLLAVAVALGAALSLVRARHVAFYLLAGAAVGVAASFLAPLLIGGVAESVLAAELISLHDPAVLAATAVAGLIDGAVFWLIVRHFD